MPRASLRSLARIPPHLSLLSSSISFLEQLIGSRYHSLYPLEEENVNREKSKVFGVTTSLYKVTSTLDGMGRKKSKKRRRKSNSNIGQTYALRRVDGYRVNNDSALAAADAWKTFTHPGVVSLKDVFHSKEFGDVNCMYHSPLVPSFTLLRQPPSHVPLRSTLLCV